MYSINCFADFTKGGNAYKNGDFETAAQEFLKVAEKGDHRAMYALGSMYAAGHGVEQDYQEAFKWLSRAAKHGRPDAQYKVGVMYEQGAGVRQSYNKAGKYYSKAANKGYSLAQYKLGLLYSNGNGVKQNYVKAYAWMTTAALRLKYTATDVPETTGDKKLTEVEIQSAQYKQDKAVSSLEELTKEIDLIEKKMTPEQIEEATALAEKFSQY